MDGVICTALKKIKNPKGDIFHAMKETDVGYERFGEAYFTSIFHGEIKGWKKHYKMTLNLIVPCGSVLFYIHDETTGKTDKVLVNSDNYYRLTISPGLWVAFEGIGDSLNLILNIASLEHDPLESLSKPIETFNLDEI
ncbi:dTDP-4-dehydrorhamnose 3,5-epimerase [Vibrio harveyi]